MIVGGKKVIHYDHRRLEAKQSVSPQPSCHESKHSVATPAFSAARKETVAHGREYDSKFSLLCTGRRDENAGGAVDFSGISSQDVPRIFHLACRLASLPQGEIPAFVVPLKPSQTQDAGAGEAERAFYCIEGTEKWVLCR